ncbi:MAG: hypothetical protein HC905_29115, partial [Bacteroidales bacterium]|nr:hypothetical protein [Bacteroidales bacterium]
MKTNKNICYILLMVMELILMLPSGCKKDLEQVPTIKTFVVTNIGTNTATCGGDVMSNGGSAVIARGVCWSNTEYPTIVDNKTIDSSGLGSFMSSMEGLTANTTYFVRAYATNIEGTGYGDTISFSTHPLTIPELTTIKVRNITITTATSGGSIINDGGAPITAQGICWSTSEYPTIADNKTVEDIASKTFSSNLSGLMANSTYFIRAYATNISGTGYGKEYLAFKTYAGTVTDIDGNVYFTSTNWIEGNLKTTKYQNGDEIYRNAAKQVLPSASKPSSSSSTAVDVRHCNHYFHKECITQWLQTSRGFYFYGSRRTC